MKRMLIIYLLLSFGCVENENIQENDRIGTETLGLDESSCEVACGLTPDGGPCKAYFKKYYFDHAEGKCKEFIWGGCDGTIPFDSLSECEACKCKE